jgi:hypothetical protein
MPRWSTTRRSVIVAVATGVLLVSSSPVRAESRLDQAGAGRGSFAPLQPVQLAGSSVTQHSEIIHRFIGAINAGRPTEAVGMLSAELAPDAAAKREWTRHFSAIKSIHVMAIEPSAVAVTAPCQEYKVTLEARVSADPEAAIPFYGWEDNPNYRWIELCPDRTGAWVIVSFGTGP